MLFNSKVEYETKVVSYLSLPSYGMMYVGDKGVEFYNSKAPRDFIIIPWEEIDYISASVIFGKYVNRFAIFTKKNGYFTFSASRNNKKTLRAINKHVPSEKMFRSQTFFGLLKKMIMKYFK